MSAADDGEREIRALSDLPLARGEQVEIRPGRHLSIAYQPGTHQADTALFFGHGSGGHKDLWRALSQAFSDQGYSLVAWDLLGHGDSEKPRQPQAYAWSEMVADQLEILSHYTARRNIPVAHSFGTGLGAPTQVAMDNRIAC